MREKRMKSKKMFAKISSFLKEAIAELKKVIWPNRDELKNSTATVISTIIIYNLL